jgi:hypothetical protein
LCCASLAPGPMGPGHPRQLLSGIHGRASCASLRSHPARWGRATRVKCYRAFLEELLVLRFARTRPVGPGHPRQLLSGIPGRASCASLRSHPARWAEPPASNAIGRSWKSFLCCASLAPGPLGRATRLRPLIAPRLKSGASPRGGEGDRSGARDARTTRKAG